MVSNLRSLARSFVAGASAGVFLCMPATGLAGEFTDMSAGFGNTLTLAGTHHLVTANPDGTSINFWTPASEGAPAVSTSLSNPHMASADAYGNIYVADKSGQAILKITTDGLIHTFAGTHVAGFNGDGPGPAASLQISNPNGVFALPNGTVYLLDPGNHRIRRVDRAGVMTTVVNDPDPAWAPSGRALWVSQDESLIYYTHELAPVSPGGASNGAVVKQWTKARGIEVVCGKAVGFRNPGNLAVNPVDGKLYVTDRAEDDATKIAGGLFRIDGVDQRARMTGNVTQPVAAEKQAALNSFIEEPRGIAFRPDGSYFLCGHRDGNVWFVDTRGIIHQYIQGAGQKDNYELTNGKHPPLVSKDYFAQPRGITLAPNGDLLVVCNDSGFLFKVANASPLPTPPGFRVSGIDASGIHLEWGGVSGYGYRVESSPSLSGPVWSPLGAASVGPLGTAARVDDHFRSRSGEKFYRLLPAL